MRIVPAENVKNLAMCTMCSENIGDNYQLKYGKLT